MGELPGRSVNDRGALTTLGYVIGNAEGTHRRSLGVYAQIRMQKHRF